MPTQRFEGPDLDAAISRARAEAGPGARILAAERVRSGGLAGFFAREKVEIEVEVLEALEVETPAADEPGVAPTSLLDLVDMVDEAEHLSASTVIRPDRVDAIGELTGARTRETPSAPTARASDALIDARPAERAVRLSTESSSFAEVLEKIAAESAAPAPVRAAAPAAAAAAGTAGAVAAAVAGTPAAGTPAPRGPLAPAPADVPHAPTGAAAAPADVPHAPTGAAAAQAYAIEPRAIELAHPLNGVGLPPQLMPSPAARNLRQALLRRMEQLPELPAMPTTKGTVVAIVGPRHEAADVVESLCASLGSDPGLVTTITPRRHRGADRELTTAAEAFDQRRSWRRRQKPTVTVIDAGVSRSTEWAEGIIEALEPTVVFGVVDASRKIEDITSWSDALGGFDALCLNGLDDTVSPASALATGLPVALIDGEPATAERWTDLLLDRIA